MAKLCEWQLPHSLKIGLPVLAAGVIVLLIAKSEHAQPVLYTVLYMLMPIFAAAGFGCLLFIGARRNNGFMKAFAFVALFVAPFFTALIGVFDLYHFLAVTVQRAQRSTAAEFSKLEAFLNNRTALGDDVSAADHIAVCIKICAAVESD